MTILAVHGIWNRQSGRSPAEAAERLARRWSGKLADGYRAAGFDRADVELTAVYYAHLLDDSAQGMMTSLDDLTPAELVQASAWMAAAGVPVEEMQGLPTYPLRQGLDWMARHWPGGAQGIGRLMSAFLREVYVYLTRPGVRERCQQVVLDALDSSGARVLVAHSLGSVVTYEALCRRPDQKVDLLVTVGSPLGLPGVVFESLSPEPRGGRAIRPPGVGRWVNIADLGDLVALPRQLGDRFPVDVHQEVTIGAADFHTFGAYLACGLTAAAIAPYADR